jgi:glycosyltransferase involved in cell wall biosynthesis
LYHKTVLSVIGLDPVRIGAAEIWFRELSEQLGRIGCRSVLCFASQPAADIRQFLEAPNVVIDELRDSWELKWRPTIDFQRLLRRYRPDVVHCHLTGFISFYPWLARVHFVDKFFFTDHGSRPEGHVMRAAPFWKRAVVPLINYPINHVQCVSHYGYDCNVAMRLLPRDRYTVIYNAVDVSRASAGLNRSHAFRQKYSIPGQRAIVVQVSWIILQKGIQDLLRAAKLVLSRTPNVQFVIVGDGPYRSECQKLATELGISEHLTWTGVVQDPLLEGVYAAADVVCQVSRWEEVFGQVITEAMASRKPVIGTRVGGIPELINDSETGFLVQRGDVQAMAEKIVHLLNDPALRTKMGNKGRELVEAKFDHRKNVAKLIELYGVTGHDTTVQVGERLATEESASALAHY